MCLESAKLSTLMRSRCRYINGELKFVIFIVSGTLEKAQVRAWEGSTWEHYCWYGKYLLRSPIPVKGTIVVRYSSSFNTSMIPSHWIRSLLYFKGTWWNERNDRITLGNLITWPRWGNSCPFYLDCFSFMSAVSKWIPWAGTLLTCLKFFYVFLLWLMSGNPI